MANYRIAPSILSANFAKLGEEITAVIDSGADFIHFDVMDNHYVPNLTIGPLVCEAIRPLTDAIIDVHLMVEPVDRIVPDFAKAGANIISFHPEALRHIDRTIGLIKEQGCKAGLVFNPATPLELSRPCTRQAGSGADNVGQSRFRRAEIYSRSVGKTQSGAQTH